MILAGACLAILGAFLFYREWQFARERDEWIKERRELLTRIKPESAPVPEKVPELLLEPVRDDADYWASRGMEPHIPDDVQFSPEGFALQGESPFGEPPK